VAVTLLATPEVRQLPAGNPLHIVQGVLSLDLGGLERIVLDLVADEVQRGNRATVVCVERRGKLAAQVEKLGGQVISIDKPPGRSQQAVAAANQLLAELQPDVVHTHQIGALWYLGQAARHAEVPLVHTEHSDHVAMARGWYAKLRARYLWRQAGNLANRFCCVSDDIARSACRWRTVTPSRVSVVSNGINTSPLLDADAGRDVRAAFGISAGALVVGSVGRLVEVKQQDLLIRAFARLCAVDRHANTWLLLVGDGPERMRLECLATGLGVQRRVVFAGYQAQPERFYRAMDLFALTSRHEGLPLSLLEAWVAGLPVVASAVGGIPKAVAHGRTGMLFPSGDLAALTETLEGLIDAPGWMRMLGHLGRQQVEQHYSLRHMADTYESLYRALIGQRELAQ
jgi:glycosyltransferase involved in cell wall biosynthesis